jgi:hypothetical protein
MQPPQILKMALRPDPLFLLPNSFSLALVIDHLAYKNDIQYFERCGRLLIINFIKMAWD